MRKETKIYVEFYLYCGNRVIKKVEYFNTKPDAQFFKLRIENVLNKKLQNDEIKTWAKNYLSFSNKDCEFAEKPKPKGYVVETTINEF